MRSRLWIFILALGASACGSEGVLVPELTSLTAEPAFTASAPAFVRVSAGEFHTCGLKGDGAIACWGASAGGRTTPPAGRFVQLSAGPNHTCAVRLDRSVACWGMNPYGQASPPSGTFSQVGAGSSHSCGVRTDGTVACWGFNANRQAAAPAGSFTQVAGGLFHSCGLKSDGTIACWGYGGNGQASPPAGSFTEVSAGSHHSCAVRSDRSIVCWGSNAQGQVKAPAGIFAQVGNGFDFSCAVKGDAALECWGDDARGQATPPAGAFVQVSGGKTHACAVSREGAVECWGQNDLGQANPPRVIPSDKTAPVITPMVAGTRGRRGWHVSDVSVSWSVSDAESAVKASEGCAASSVEVDTDGMTFTCSATNAAGLSATVSTTVRRDATTPVINWHGSASRYTVDATVGITCSASDPTNPGSGVDSHTCQGIAGPAYTFPLGTSSFSATAADTAGHETRSLVAFEVVVTHGSLCALARRFVSAAGVARAMCQQLEAAQAAEARGNAAAESGALQGFTKLVHAQAGKSLAASDAAVLIRLAAAL